MLRGQLLPPVRKSGPLAHWLLHLAPQDPSGCSQSVTKTGTIDEGLPLDLLSWIGPAFAAWCNGVPKDQKIFKDRPDRTVALFKEVSLQLGLSGLCQYQLRHGGASHDLLTGARSEAAVRARGRWRSDSSLRRYAKPAQVQRLLSLIPVEKQPFVHSAPDSIEGVMTRRVALPRLAIG